LTTKPLKDEIEAATAEARAAEAKEAPKAAPKAAAVVSPLRKNLRQKLCEIIAGLGPMEPAGENKFHHYKYFSDEQISNLFRAALATRNVLLVPNVRSFDIRDFETEKGKHSFLTTLMIDWSIFDGDSDEVIMATTVGQGDDPGDKGANKAMTGAFKYLLIKMAQIGGEGDAEADTSTDERHAGGGDRGRSRREPARVDRPTQPVEGVQKGGRQATANEPQVNRVSLLAKELGIGFDGLVNVIKNTLEVELELPEGEEDRRKFMRAFFDGLNAEETGKIVQRLEEAKQRSAS